MKFTKPFYGVPDGQIYPVNYEIGDECPPELMQAATELGAIAKDADQPKAKAKAK